MAAAPHARLLIPLAQQVINNHVDSLNNGGLVDEPWQPIDNELVNSHYQMAMVKFCVAAGLIPEISSAATDDIAYANHVDLALCKMFSRIKGRG